MKIKLVVGLGNPGKEYEKTRHNIGFMVLDEIYKRLNINSWKERDNALFFDTNLGFSKVIFIKPQSYINLSGDVIINFIKYFDIKIENIYVICDDLNLDVGNVKLKLKGSSGGHNGLKNIEKNLNSSDYKRIKVGISNDKNKDKKDYVLEKFKLNELNCIKKSINLAADAILYSLENNFEKAMSLYNKKNKEE